MDGSEGKHARLLGGACTIGPDWKSFLATLVLVAIPIGLFFGWVAVDIGKEVSWALVGVSAALSGITYASLVTTGLRDPGIVERQPTCSLPNLRTAVYLINGHDVITKYCPTCYLYRPPRCSHCAVCDNCIEKFDHHCPWVGTCIGRRNYQPYLAFIYTASADCALLIALCVTRLVRLAQARGFGRALREEWAAAVLIPYLAAGLIFVGALSAFHTYLLSTNQTTYEYFRHRASPGDNPFSRRLWNNCFEAFCGATGLYRYHGDGGHPALANGGAGGISTLESSAHSHPRSALHSGNHNGGSSSGSGHHGGAPGIEPDGQMQVDPGATGRSLMYRSNGFSNGHELGPAHGHGV